MQDIIERLRAFDLGFHPPLSEASIETLQSGLACRLPDNALALYRDHDGHRRCGAVEWRLLPASEVVDLYNGVFQNWDRYGLRFLWYDEQSNYAGLYVDGPLLGRVCIEQHDDHDLSPRFRSIRSFLTAVLRAATEVRSVRDRDFDYTLLGPAEQGDQAADWETAQGLRRLYDSSRDDEERLDYAYAAMALTPLVHTETLVAFLDDDDMWIPERAANILGARKFEPAIAKLFEVAKQGMPNGATAAQRALQAIGTERSRECLRQLRR